MGSQAVQSLLDPVIAALGVDLEDVEVTAAGRRRRVCVVIDRDGGIDLDTVAEVSKAVSDALDGSDVLGDAPYVLEVTSPGVDRPLAQPRHWRRARGRLVACDLRDGSRVDGRILDSDDAAVTLDTAEGAQVVLFADVARARVEVEFTRPQEGGS